MLGNDRISRRQALLALGAGASAASLAALVHAADKSKSKDKTSKDKDKKSKDKDKDKDKSKGTGSDSTPASVSSGGKYGGWGGHVTGGEKGKTIQVSTVAELADAMKKGNCTILIKAKELHIDKKVATTASNITIDGQGATIWGDKLTREMQMLHFEGSKNIFVKNIRLRNGGDNISFKTCSDILLYHVSTTGAGDDGFSCAYGCKNVTISHCFDAGCTRAVFCKYNETDKITISHTVILKNWIRAPKMFGVPNFDVRNCIFMDWDQHAADIDTSSGNLMGNLYIMHKFATGKRHGVSYFAGKVGKVYFKDNVLRDCTNPNKSTTDSPIQAPPIVPPYTTNIPALEQQLMSDTSGAGCMPRDSVDKQYLAATTWKVGSTQPFRLNAGGDAKPPKGGKKK